MKYLLIIILISSCVVYKQPKLSSFKEPMVLCNCPTDSLFRTAVIVKPNQDSCQHFLVRVTLLGCIPPSSQCNTATCMSCGKQWKTN